MQARAVEQVFEDFLGGRSEPAWLREYRQNRFDAFVAAKVQPSHYTDLKRLEGMLSKPSEGSPLKINARKEAPKGGLIALEINEAVKSRPELVKKCLMRERSSMDKFELHSGAFFSTGYFIFVPKGTNASAEIEISPQAGSACLKNVIALEQENALALGERVSAGSGEAALSSGTSAFIDNASRLEFSSFNGMGDDSTSISSRRVMIGKDSVSSALYGWFGSKESKSNVWNHLCGQGAEARHREVVFGSGNQHFDLSSDLLHEVPDTSAKISVRAALNDESSSIFNGMIKISKEAQRTNSFLEAHSILLGKNASSNNVPGLEIEANDVKATHSASVHKLDDEEIFYLESRGIPKTEAKRMLVSSFFEAVVNEFQGESERQRFLEGIAQKYGQ